MISYLASISKNAATRNMDNVQIPLKKSKVINGLKISYLDEGKGEVIFCLPPWPSPSLVFVPLISLIGNKYRIISLDMPGWVGDSQRPPQAASLDYYTQIIEKFINSFGFRKVNILGYSYGGLVAEVIASRGRVKIHKIALISAPLGLGNLNQHLKWPLNIYRNVGQKVIPDNLIITAIDKWLFDESKWRDYKRYETLIRVSKKQIGQFDAKSALLCLMAGKKPLLDIGRLKKIPILIVYGSLDHNFIKQDMSQLATLIGHNPVVIEGGDHGHFFYETEKSAPYIKKFFAPDSLYDILKQWIKKTFT